MKTQLQIGTCNLCNGLAMKMDYVKAVIKEKTIDVLYLQETEIPNGYDNIPGFKLECENKTQEKKVRIVCYILIHLFIIIFFLVVVWAYYFQPFSCFCPCFITKFSLGGSGFALTTFHTKFIRILANQTARPSPLPERNTYLQTKV